MMPPHTRKQPARSVHPVADIIFASRRRGRRASYAAFTMASFIGTTVQVRLRTGATFIGTILEVDPATATLKMRRQDSGESCQVRRDELVDVTKVAPPAARSTTSGASNMSSKASKVKDEVSQTAPKATAEEGASEGRKKRNQRRKNESRVASPAPAAAMATSVSDAPSAPFDSEFDFTKSTQNFDRKKIWDEIRVRLSCLTTEPRSSQPSSAREH